MPSDYAWLSALGPVMSRHRAAIAELLAFCETSTAVSSLSVGCSIGRSAGDELSDIDAAIGVTAPRGAAGIGQIHEVEEQLIDALPDLGNLVDVLRSGSDNTDFAIRKVFVQFSDRVQLDLAIIAEVEVRRGDGAPDFVPLYWQEAAHATTRGPSAYEVPADRLRQWAFLGWRALLDADKYLQRGSMWEAHQRLHEAREQIWMLWAAARGTSYPWHGLSQVLDDSPNQLPPGIEATVAGLNALDLRCAVSAAADVMSHCSAQAAASHNTHMPNGIAQYARRILCTG